jgi:hypothetical protein
MTVHTRTGLPWQPRAQLDVRRVDTHRRKIESPGFVAQLLNLWRGRFRLEQRVVNHRGQLRDVCLGEWHGFTLIWNSNGDAYNLKRKLGPSRLAFYVGFDQRGK